MSANDNHSSVLSVRLEQWRRIWDILLAPNEESQSSTEKTEAQEGENNEKENLEH